MTPFQKMLDAMRHEALLPKHQCQYEAAQTRRMALRWYGSPTAVVGVLGNQDTALLERKDELLRAFISEQQASPSPFWSALSVLCCAPMLGRLRRRIVADDESGAEVDQLVMAAFLDVVATFPMARLRDRTFARIRKATERIVFGKIASRTRDRWMEPPMDPSTFNHLD